MIRTLAAFVLATATLAAADGITVYLYSEYIDPAIPAQFAAATGIAVRIDTYESQDDMLAKLQAGGTSAYDVVVASDVVVPAMIALKLLRPLDQKAVLNGANVDQRFRDPPYDRGNAYSWPYQWGTVGLMYRTDKVKGEISWGLLFDAARQPGPFVMMDEMRTTLAVAQLFRGGDVNTRQPDEIKKAGQLVLAAKGSAKCLGFDGGVGGMNKVLAGEAALAMVYNGDAVKNLPSDGSCAFAVPKEGSGLWVDVMTVSAQAPNPAGAHAFINYILDAKVGAQLSSFLRYASPNAAAKPLLMKVDLDNPAIYPPTAVMDTLKYQQDVGPAAPVYDEVWTAVKAQ